MTYPGSTTFPGLLTLPGTWTANWPPLGVVPVSVAHRPRSAVSVAPQGTVPRQVPWRPRIDVDPSFEFAVELSTLAVMSVPVDVPLVFEVDNTVDIVGGSLSITVDVPLVFGSDVSVAQGFTVDVPLEFAAEADYVTGPPRFIASGMTKSGTQNFTTSWEKLLGWTADTANYPGSTVVDNSLDVQGAKPNATITVSLPYTGSFTNPHTARILVNGVVVSTGAAVSTQSGTMTATATNVALTDADKVGVEVMVGTYANGSVSAGGYVRIT